MSGAQPVAIEVLLAESAWVRRLAESLVRDPAAAEDVVQQTWLAALQRPPAADRPLRPWLRVVVENFARMRVRSEGARAARETAAARPEAELSPDALCERVETQRWLAKEVLELDEPFRSTVVLHYYEALSSAEIARRTKTPEGTVRWRLKRGLDELRERLDRRHGGSRREWQLALLPLIGAPALPGSSARAWPLAAGAALLAGLSLLVALVRPWERAARERSAVAPAELADRASESIAVGAERAAARGGAAELAVERGSQRTVVARVLDSAGVPIAGARLETDGASARSTGDGEVRLVLPDFAPRAARIALRIDAEGFAEERVELVASADGELHLGEVALAGAGVLRGRVASADGSPVGGAWVRLERLGTRWAGVDAPPLEEARWLGSLLPEDAPSLATAADGSFRFPRVREGYVRLWYGAEGCDPAWSDELAVAARRELDAGTLVLAATDPARCIEGLVLDPQGRPVPGARIECARRSLRGPFFRGSGNVQRALADDRGAFRVCVNPSSQYELAAAAPDGSARPVLVGPVSPGARGVAVRLAEWRPLAIEAFDARGRPLADVQVAFVDARRGEPLDELSSAWLGGERRAPWCEFAVRVRARGFAALELGPFDPDTAPERLTAVLEPSWTVRGVVLGASQPVAGARVELLEAADAQRTALSQRTPGFDGFRALVAGSEGRAAAESDADGAFVLEIPAAGPWFVRVEAAGWAVHFSGPYELGPRGPRELPVELEAGGALAGRVVRVDGGAVAGTLVGLSCGDGRLATRRVGPSGEFRFEGLRPGPWQVRRVPREALGWEALQLAPGGGAPLRWDAEVPSGGEARCDVVLDPASAVRLEGRLSFDGAPAGPWGLELSLGALRETALLAPDGSYSVELPREGEWTLRAAWQPRGGVALRFEERLSLRRGTNRHARDWGSAALTLEAGPALAGASLALRWSEPGRAALELSAELDRDGRAHLPRAPAGALELAVDDRAPSVLQLRPGERRTLELR